MAQYPVSVRSLGTGIGEEIDYDTLSIMDDGNLVQMPPVPSAEGPMSAGMAAAGTAGAIGASQSSGLRSKMGNLFRKRSPRSSVRDNDAELEADKGLGIGGADIPTSLSSSADAHTYISANNGVPYATSRPSISEDNRSIKSRGGPGMSTMMATADPVTSPHTFIAGGVRKAIDLFRSGARMSFILRPIDAIADNVPALEPTVVIIEMIMLMWLLYEVSLLLEVVTSVTKTVTKPAVMLGRMLGFAFKK